MPVQTDGVLYLNYPPVELPRNRQQGDVLVRRRMDWHALQSPGWLD